MQEHISAFLKMKLPDNRNRYSMNRWSLSDVKVMIVLLCLSACRSHPEEIVVPLENTVYYQKSDSLFPNPERGFYRFTYWDLENESGFSDGNGQPLDIEQLREFRNNNNTLVYAFVHLRQFKDRPLSVKALENFARNMEYLRKAGLKCILRFAYSNSHEEADAPIEVIMTHYTQLEPYIRDHADVIAVMQAGFIGSWGEWAYSPSHLITEEERNMVLGEVLRILPENRFVQVRVPKYKMDYLGRDVPLSENEAFSGVAAARIAHHNDCFMSSPNDYGTYRDSSDRQYLATESLYLPVGGETCRPVDIDPADCNKAQQEMCVYHWSFLHEEWYLPVNDCWKEQGCMDDIIRELGYRLELESVKYADCVAPGSRLKLEIRLYNRGYAALYNPRLAELILKNEHQEYRVKLDEDPRRWEPGAVSHIEVEAGIPEDMVEGKYRLYLHLPDPDKRLYGNADYSVRLANENVWEPEWGYNNLGIEIKVDPRVRPEQYTGHLFFTLSGSSLF